MTRALALTVSNRAAAGIYEDKSGPVLAELLRAAGCDEVDGPIVIPDGATVEVESPFGIPEHFHLLIAERASLNCPARLRPYFYGVAFSYTDNLKRR